MNIPQLYYSIDELALYLAGLNPFEVSSVNQAEYENWTNSAEAKQWQITIVQHLASKSLRLRGDVYIKTEQHCHSLDGEVISDYYSPFDLLVQELDSINPPLDKRVIPVIEIVKWAERFSIKLWFNYELPAENGKTASKVIQPEPNQSEGSNCSCPDWVKDVELLLDYSHEKTAPELAIALRSWLKAIKDPKINQINVPDGIQDYFPDGLSNAATERLRTVTNWNKLGNAQKK
ncbi:hypothetical protein [Vibrio proteolyticus]|uniref:Uncharacterized protein n=1 Tax=Vibrio proteolyticus NBRC 13287 TaxID=1219065 RepID=U3BQS4_VIBPR|nr:hypothetical protein [Vibrio proteolyticus]GAD68853.1 hypothetical protein VPR01S_20_00330 [Vibrio proteolyticus NBRC 13287]